MIQRFFPSEFGNDVDRAHAVEPAKTTYNVKSNFRREVEASGIPYTYIVGNFFSGYFLPTLNQPGATAPPRDKIVVLGDGNTKGKYNPLWLLIFDKQHWINNVIHGRIGLAMLMSC